MNKASAPSAPMPEFEGNEFQGHPPPPSYDQAMSVYPPPVPEARQGGHAPYPPQQLPYPPTAAQMSYPPTVAQPPYPAASSQMPYPPAGQQMPYPPAGQQMPYPPVGTQTQPPYPVQQPQGFIPSGEPHSIPQTNVPPPQPPAPQQTSVTTAVFVNGPVAVGPKPCRVRCPMCHSDIKTSTVTENQAGAHIACIILCLLGCFLCSCIPYCMDSCKIVQHKCPVCKSYLGTYKG
ncbi:lipopolysaccharide-induced tumor necrosis factor-alpha factor homolog [Schistocerca piceifrons]|uniref:lipopolysaccharide-induced tumor necrosis factor-alpha factor homolog n=1 Tax=Schistocerca piceifrons TaxID=274613 RepID=UPI001F5FBCBA|nr:lipopolysaccharide-induced tumor necrosis factor-alpha factor homolog [Schistocerca piceifrons]